MPLYGETMSGLNQAQDREPVNAPPRAPSRDPWPILASSGPSCISSQYATSGKEIGS